MPTNEYLTVWQSSAQVDQALAPLSDSSSLGSSGKFPEGGECDIYPSGGISCLNTGKLKQVAMAVYEYSMEWILFQETLHTIVFLRKRCCSIESYTHELAYLYVLVFHKLDKGRIDGLGTGGFQEKVLNRLPILDKTAENWKLFTGCHISALVCHYAEVGWLMNPFQ